MAQEWEMSIGMDFVGMGMRSTTTSPEPVAPFAVSSPARHYGHPPADQSIRIDDLLDFSNHDHLFPSSAEAPTDHSSASTGSCLMPYDQTHSQLSSFDLYTPCEEAAELEWLSKFVDDSFSDVPNYNSIWLAPPTTGTEPRQPQQEQSIAAARGARSKRSRATAAWSSSSPSASSSSSSSDFPSSNQNAGGHDRHRSNHGGKREAGSGGGGGGGVRRCSHCASEKTPQWRTGPMGPKTLCNACGVRYKSGRLVPEYRPAASPSFMMMQHSNSHRKVIELRRQKEELLLLDNSAAMPATRPELFFDEHLRNYGVR